MVPFLSNILLLQYHEISLSVAVSYFFQLSYVLMKLPTGDLIVRVVFSPHGCFAVQAVVFCCLFIILCTPNYPSSLQLSQSYCLATNILTHNQDILFTVPRSQELVQNCPRYFILEHFHFLYVSLLNTLHDINYQKYKRNGR